MKHLHILGVCGTAMAGIAALAQAKGLRVTGSDSGVYPPMSRFLENLGIPICSGYRAQNLDPTPDLVLVGNALSRGNPELEALMESGIPYRSGAQWLYENVLEGRHPLVVSGTHGKTTTTSLLAQIWEKAGWEPGFLIGGVPQNFGTGARFPKGSWVMVEGDEYDTAFFDKRPKFLHYRPKTLILHNLEFDHADIYPDLEAIRHQFRLLLRTVPASGYILANGDDPEIVGLLPHAFSRVVQYGMGGDPPFSARMDREDGRSWTLIRDGRPIFAVRWGLIGRHNVMNGLAAATAALLHGVDPQWIQTGLESFQGVARRLQLSFEINGITVYDDFAHHPTAVATTLAGVRAAVAKARVWAVLEPRSNTMRLGTHQARLAQALTSADHVVIARPATRGNRTEVLLDVDAIAASLNETGTPGGDGLLPATVVSGAVEAVAFLAGHVAAGDHIVIMSNGGFDGIHDRLRGRFSETGGQGEVP